MTIIISIDPGYDRCGIAIIKKEIKEELLFSECFITDREQELTDRVYAVGQEIERIIKKFKPTVMAIENVYFQNNQKTIIGVSEVKGVCKYLAKNVGLEVYEYTPLQIKTAITGNGKATKKQVAWMVPKLIAYDPAQRAKELGGASSGIDDEIDAIAVGLTYFAYQKK
ncbi:crossover junction endodeoxyribonuclease RuvC [Candidatus Nomurabacteria bacterium]|nr:crossover junction endodeoxyribonuclease RuvC [Candidatus Nomurabacteria bacterium]